MNISWHTLELNIGAGPHLFSNAVISPRCRAYVYDIDGKFMSRASHEADPGKEYGPVYGEFEDEVKDLILEHANSTGSTVALGILNNWNSAIKKFVQVFPVDFKAALEKVRCPALNPEP